MCLAQGEWRRSTGIPKRGPPGSTSVHKMDLIKQLGELFLQAVPTVIIVFLFYLFLRANFFKPIERILAERTARVEGARSEASAAQTAAQEKLNAYEEALKKARSGIYAEQEAARQAVLDERAKLIRSYSRRGATNHSSGERENRSGHGRGADRIARADAGNGQ